MGKKDEPNMNLLQERRDKEKAQSEMEGSKDETIRKERRDKEEAQSEVRMLKNQLESKNKEFEKQQTEVKQLKDDIQKMDTGLKSLMEDLQSDTLEDLKKYVPPVSYVSSKSATSRFQRVESVPVQSSPSLSKWPEVLRQKFQEKLQKKITELQEEHDRRDKAEKDVLKKELQYKTHQKQNSSSLSQNSTRKLAVVVKVDPWGRYIQLRNTSTEDQQLEGWVLKIQVNDKEPIIHTFEDSFNLKTGHVFTVGCCGYDKTYPCAQLVLEDLKSWRYADNLQVSLISHPGEIQYNLDRIY